MSQTKRFLLILALVCLWSPSFLFIKLAVSEIPPMTVVSLRVGLAACVMVLLLAFRGTSMPRDRSFWLHSAGMAFFASAAPFCLFCFAETTIDSGLAGLLNGMTPMWTALLAHRFIASDALHTQKLVGIGLGMTGLCLLCVPQIGVDSSIDVVGMCAAALASFSYAVSHVYAKKFTTGQAPFVAPMAQFFWSLVMTLPLALVFETPLSLDMPSGRAWLGVLGLVCLGTVLAFILYYKLLEECGPTAVSMVACFFPVGAMILGFLFLGESLTMTGAVAAALILGGMLIVNDVVKIPALRPAHRSSS